jgi:hypothetical protein
MNQELIANNTIPKSWDDFECGQNVVYTDTATREFHLIVNGKNKAPYSSKFLHRGGLLRVDEIQMNSVRCIGPCNEDIVEVEEVEPEFRYWSNTTSWPNGELPKAGEDVDIISGWKMILDIEETPIFKQIRVNGILIFSDLSDIHLHAKQIYVRAGELHIGNETHPFEHNA